MNSKPFKMPHPELYYRVEDALWEYYEKCFPQYDEGYRYDLTQDVLVQDEQTVKRLYKEEKS
jgi:hypothetical protein